MNFKCQVKSHKLRLQAYSNKTLLKWSHLCFSITWLHGNIVTTTLQEVTTRLLSKRCTCSQHLVTVVPPKVNILGFIETTCQWHHEHFGVTPSILSKRRICCPHLVIPLGNIWMKDVSRFLRRLSFHVFMHFMLLNLSQSNFLRLLLSIP